jgi:hypothetical protein
MVGSMGRVAEAGGDAAAATERFLSRLRKNVLNR